MCESTLALKPIVDGLKAKKRYGGKAYKSLVKGKSYMSWKKQAAFVSGA